MVFGAVGEHGGNGVGAAGIEGGHSECGVLSSFGGGDEVRKCLSG